MNQEFLEKTPKLITTNPPAKKIALANRKKNMMDSIDRVYDNYIKEINHYIKNGELEITICITNNSNVRKYGKLEIYNYLAARKLRKNGFKVKLLKRRETTHPEIHTPYYMSAYRSYYKAIKISWKHE